MYSGFLAHYSDKMPPTWDKKPPGANLLQLLYFTNFVIRVTYTYIIKFPVNIKIKWLSNF